MNEGMRMGRNLDRYKIGAGTRGMPPIAVERGRDKVVYSTEQPKFSGARELPLTEQAKERAENIATVLKQPHRAGSDNPRLGTALGRFCAAQRLGDHCWHAGERYGEIIQDAKLAMGFSIRGGAWGADGGWQELTDAQLEARKELALARLKDAELMLRAIMPRLPAALDRLCYDDRDPSPYDHGIIIAALVKLASEWGFSPKRFGEA